MQQTPEIKPANGLATALLFGVPAFALLFHQYRFISSLGPNYLVKRVGECAT